MPKEGPSQGEQFKAKIEKGVERALPAEKLKNLKDKVKEKTKESNKLKRKIKDAIKKGFTVEKTKDLAITSAEKKQVFENVKSSLASKLGSPQEAKALLARFGIKSSRDLMRKIGLSRISEQRTYEHYAYSAIKGPGVCFRDYDKIITQPWGKKILDKAFKTNHKYVFVFAHKFTKLPEEGMNLLIKATDKSPKLAFAYAERLKHIKGADKILINALGKIEKTDMAFKYFHKYKNMPGAVNVLNFAAEKNRDDALLHLSKYKKSPGASKVLLTAINQMPDTEDFFKKIDTKLKEVKNVKMVLAAAALKNPNAALKYFDKYSDIDDPNYVLLSSLSLMTDTTPIFYFVEKFIKHKGGRDVLMLAASLGADTEAVLDAFDEFQKVEGAGQILAVAIYKNPKIIFEEEYFPDFLENLSEGDAAYMVNTAVSAKPELAFSKIDAILTFDSSGKTFITAATKNPTLVYKNLHLIEGKIDESLKKDILRAAFDNLKPHHYMSEDIKVIGEHLTKEQAEIIVDKIRQCNQFAEKFLEQNLKTVATGLYGRTKSKSEMIKNLYEDRSLQNILKVKTEWIKIPKTSDLRSVEARAMIARNLFTDGIPVTKENVQKELNRIIEDRNKLKNTHIFKGRNVLHVAQNEYYTATVKEKRVFGRKATLDAIKAQGGNLTSMMCANNPDVIKKFKQQLIDKIANTKPPLTFYYSGHGAKESVDLIAGKLKFTSADLALALKQRYQNFKDNPVEKEKPPIIIISSCYTANYVKKMYQKLHRVQRKPIAMGGSEFGQLAYGADQVGKQDSAFADKVLGLGSKEPATFETVMKNEKKDLSNAYVHLPSRRQVV